MVKGYSVKPTFLLCIGEPKSGTSWLHYYLHLSSKFADVGIKEFNVWTSYFNLGIIGEKNSTFDRMSKGLPINKESNQWNHKTRGDLKLLCCMEKIEGFYAEYFNALISDTDYTIVGDFSPNYKILGEYELRYIKHTLSKYFNVKLVYLFRDPIERAWSAHIHRAQALGRRLDVEQFFEEFNIDDYFSQSSFYDRTAKNIRKVFDVEDSFIEPYEFFFTEKKIKQLSEWLGIEYNKEAIQRKINKRFIDKPLPVDVKKRMYELVKDDYKDTYEWCKESFPLVYDKWMESLT
jgi:hypothetical protein